MAKNFVEILKENVSRFEKNFGEIKMPKMKKQAPDNVEVAGVASEKYSYIG